MWLVDFLLLGTRTTLTSFGTRTTLASFGTRTTLTTLRTLTTCGTLLIVGWLLDKNSVRELVLACLRVNLKQLHLYLVAFLDTCLFNCLKALPVNLADVEQTVLARENLYEASVRHDRAYCSVINLTNLRDGNDGLDLAKGCVDAFLVGSTNLHLANSVNLVDGDGGTCVLLHLLDNLSTRTDNSTDELLRYLNLYDTWYLWS